MSPLLTLISPFPYIDLPTGFLGWLGFIILTAAILGMHWNWRALNRSMSRGRWILLIVLLISTPFTSLVFGFRLTESEVLPPYGLAIIAVEPITMILAAIPWVLAAGILGPLSAAVLAFFSGVLLGLWNTHSLFTSVELAILASIFSICVRQRYRTPFYRLLSHPVSSAILVGLIYPVVHLFVQMILSEGLLVERLDYAFQNLANAALAFLISLFIAAVLAEIIHLIAPQLWTEDAPLIPSPSERSLQIRFSQKIAPLAIALLFALVIGDWIIAGRAARDMIQGQMVNAAELAAQNIPFFLQTGQTLITQLAADQTLLSNQPAQLQEVLTKEIKTIAFFNQLSIIGPENEVISSYPSANFVGPQSPLHEQLGIQFAFNGYPIQFFTIPPAENQRTAQFSFIAPIFNTEGSVERVLIGRSDLDTNPYTQPILSGLNSLTGRDDIAMMIDEDGMILYHSDPTLVMTKYSGQAADGPTTFEETLPNGTRMLVHFKPVSGISWSIVLMVPIYRAQRLALNIATPLLAMIAVLTIFILFLLRYGLSVVTVSLKSLAHEAGRIAQGKLDQPLSVESIDEVGELRRAFEQMRISLKERLIELNRLLLVSQGVAASLDISDAVKPVLEAALSAGASSARVVLAPSMISDLDNSTSIPLSFGIGLSQNLYRNLDEQILALTRQLDRLVLSNLNRPRLLNITPGIPLPESLMAVALRHENQYFGTLWIAYDQPHIFSEEEVRFMVTLGSQAALAAVNARLFLTAEIGRQRLESILASSPDAVLVTDQRDQLLLANPAAWQVLGLSIEETNRGQPINQVIKEPELLNLLSSSNTKKQSLEITLPGGRIFLATATPVLAEGQRMGRVCVLRDITHFKELDALKSEFVSTVSHDLRSPLTLMRGYATMLEMVGQLNEQQYNYVQKIISGVENMSRMVNNLLDLGRIESGVGLQIERVNVQEVVERVIGSFQLQATQKRIQLTNEISEEQLPIIEADQALLQQALNNLVENAIKFTRPEGKVHVRVRVQPIGVVFEVIDNGAGISPVDQPHLFEKFFRGAQQGSKELRGTGLGLAIVRSIAEKHGGRVWADSQLGKGSTFYLAIPISQGVPEINS